MAGVLGFSGKTPHNGFGDYFVSGGILYLVLYLLILCYSIRKLISYKKLINRKLYLSLFFFLILFIVNVPFYSGIMINPSLSSIFWIIIGYISILELNGHHKIATS
jgi:O-antigen ligase